MKYLPNRLTKQRFLFLLGITVIYVGLVIWLDFLHGAYWHDEKYFWETSIGFSRRLLPTLDDLRSYKELNTRVISF